MLLHTTQTLPLDAVAKVGIVAALSVTILQGIKKLVPQINGWWAVAFNLILSFALTIAAHPSALISAISASGLHSLARPNAPPLAGNDASSAVAGMSPGEPPQRAGNN